MLWKRFKTGSNDAKTEGMQKEESAQAMTAFLKMLEEAKNQPLLEQIALCDFLLNVAKHDLQYHTIADGVQKSVSHQAPKAFVFPYSDTAHPPRWKLLKVGTTTVNINCDTVIAFPGEQQRIILAASKLYSVPFEYISSNHTGIHYRNMDITFVFGGNHSITAGIIFQKEGSITVDDYDDTPLFDNLETDGWYWLDKKTGNILSVTLPNPSAGKDTINELLVHDYRVAIIFKLTAKKILLLKQAKKESNSEFTSGEPFQRQLQIRFIESDAFVHLVGDAACSVCRFPAFFAGDDLYRRCIDCCLIKSFNPVNPTSLHIAMCDFCNSQCKWKLKYSRIDMIPKCATCELFKVVEHHTDKTGSNRGQKE